MLLLFTTGCSSASNQEIESSLLNQLPVWAACPTEYYAKKEYLATNFDRANTSCTQLEVPISYDNLKLGTKTIALMGIGDKSQPHVFYNPGGPGASGIEAIQTINYPAELTDNYFIVGFDPRGVGFSSPVRCDDKADLESYFETDLYIETLAEAEEAESKYLDFIATCAAANPYWWTITTQNTVKDIELMRAVLTKKPLNFIGSSYGTTLAMEYLRAYPENIGKIMLDSPVLIGLDLDQDRLEQARGFDEAFERLFEACAKDDNCPGNTALGSAELFKQKLVQADQGKVLGYFGITKSVQFPKSTIASANLMLDGLYQMSYFELEDIYRDFKAGFVDLITENDSWIFEYYGLLYNGYDPETKKRSNMNEILYIVNCLDIDSRRFKSESELKKFDRQIQQTAPLVHYLNTSPNNFFWLPKRQGCEWSWLAVEDDLIPDPPAKVPGPVNESGKQLLIIASTGDNATPYSGAVKVAEQLKSPLITYDGTGHAIAFNGNACLAKLISDFFGQASPKLTDVTCARD